MIREKMVGALAALLTLGGCSEHTTSPDNEEQPPTATGSVSVQDDQFVASSIRILTGGSVTWTWRGGNQHNVTFTGGPVSATQIAGTFQRTFDTPGTFAYQCTVHGQAMSGRVTVVNPTEGGASPPSDY